ncbi:hypothetical protein ACP70R_004072 [Stipagrostis hirtigluma subsp. patula]
MMDQAMALHHLLVVDRSARCHTRFWCFQCSAPCARTAAELTGRGTILVVCHPLRIFFIAGVDAMREESVKGCRFDLRGIQIVVYEGRRCLLISLVTGRSGRWPIYRPLSDLRPFDKERIPVVQSWLSGELRRGHTATGARRSGVSSRRWRRDDWSDSRVYRLDTFCLISRRAYRDPPCAGHMAVLHAGHAQAAPTPCSQCTRSADGRSCRRGSSPKIGPELTL